MAGTTLCPHCHTRFKIAEAQLEAHHGMVRCGHCFQAFDALPNFIPDEPNPQLELPMLEEPVAHTEQSPVDDLPPEAEAPLPEPGLPDEQTPDDESLAEAIVETAAKDIATPSEETVAEQAEPSEIPHDDLLNFNQPSVDVAESITQPVAPPAEVATLKPMTLAEQVAVIKHSSPTEPEAEPVQPKRRTWLWAIASLLLLFVMLAQAAYFFRVELAARLPGLKPALVGYCQLLKCSVPLSQQSELMSIESSDLEAEPEHENQIILTALLRNRAPYAQAFPNLELTLNDSQDKPLARRTFRPADYLPPVENEKTGLLPNHEISLKLHLDTTDLKASGYRLALFYPQ